MITKTFTSIIKLLTGTDKIFYPSLNVIPFHSVIITLWFISIIVKINRIKDLTNFLVEQDMSSNGARQAVAVQYFDCEKKSQVHKNLLVEQDRSKYTGARRAVSVQYFMETFQQHPLSALFRLLGLVGIKEWQIWILFIRIVTFLH